MTRLLLVCHEDIAKALSAVAQTILGQTINAAIVGVGAADDADLVAEQIAHEVRNLCADDPPLVLTDLPGATPHNFAMQAVAELCPNAPVVTGLNLPMLLKALNHAGLPARELAPLVAEGARVAIVERPGNG